MLLAAVSMPLPAGALETLVVHCGLLVSEGGETRVAGEWVRSALSSLHRGAAARAPGVRERLMRFYASLTDPAPAIAALLSVGDSTAAFELFRRAGGAYYGYAHGYHALERVLAFFGPQLEQRSEDIFLARLWMLVKTGKTREALLRLEARHPGLPVDLRSLRLSHRPELLLLRADMSLDLDGTPPLEVIASWGRLQAFMEPGDELSRGLLYQLDGHRLSAGGCAHRGAPARRGGARGLRKCGHAVSVAFHARASGGNRPSAQPPGRGRRAHRARREPAACLGSGIQFRIRHHRLAQVASRLRAGPLRRLRGRDPAPARGTRQRRQLAGSPAPGGGAGGARRALERGPEKRARAARSVRARPEPTTRRDCEPAPCADSNPAAAGGPPACGGGNVARGVRSFDRCTPLRGARDRERPDSAASCLGAREFARRAGTAQRRARASSGARAAPAHLPRAARGCGSASSGSRGGGAAASAYRAARGAGARPARGAHRGRRAPGAVAAGFHRRARSRATRGSPPSPPRCSND